VSEKLLRSTRQRLTGFAIIVPIQAAHVSVVGAELATGNTTIVCGDFAKGYSARTTGVRCLHLLPGWPVRPKVPDRYLIGHLGL